MVLLASPFSGALIVSNDNWQETRKAQILASGLAPTDAHESVILTQLPAGGYTAIVRSANDATGIALVEIYNASTDADPPQNTILRRVANRGSDDQTNPSPRIVSEKEKNRLSQATLKSKLAAF